LTCTQLLAERIRAADELASRPHLRTDLVDALRAFNRQFLVLDNDDPGVEATLLLQQQLGDTAISVALPDGIKDPSQFATQSDGREQFAAALLQAVGHLAG
jgi:DNA primase